MKAPLTWKLTEGKIYTCLKNIEVPFACALSFPGNPTRVPSKLIVHSKIGFLKEVVFVIAGV